MNHSLNQLDNFRSLGENLEEEDEDELENKIDDEEEESE